MKLGGKRERVVLVFVDPNPDGVCRSEDVCCYTGFRDLFLLGLTLVCLGFFCLVGFPFFFQNPVSSLSPLLNETI